MTHAPARPDDAVDAEWAVTLFSFTPQIVAAERTPDEVLADVVAAGLGSTIEVDAPQHFRSYPSLDGADTEAFAALVSRLGVRLSLLGVYDDAGLRSDRPFTLEESADYVGRQIEAAAAMGFAGARIAFGVRPELLERLAEHAEAHGITVLQEAQGNLRPDSPTFERQWDAIDRIGSDLLGFVLDLSACMPALPVTYLDLLEREGVPRDAVGYLAGQWGVAPHDEVRAGTEERLNRVLLSPAARDALFMAWTRFGSSRVAGWRDALPRVGAVHLKFWDLEDDDRRVSQPLTDLRALLAASSYRGVVTSEWGGHAWLGSDPVEMTRRHRQLYERAGAGLGPAPADGAAARIRAGAR